MMKAKSSELSSLKNKLFIFICNMLICIQQRTISLISHYESTTLLLLTNDLNIFNQKNVLLLFYFQVTLQKLGQNFLSAHGLKQTFSFWTFGGRNLIKVVLNKILKDILMEPHPTYLTVADVHHMLKHCKLFNIFV